MHNRDMLWYDSHFQREIKLSDMDDVYLANVLSLITRSLLNKDEDIVNNFKEEVKYRGLPQIFMDHAPYTKDYWGLSAADVLSMDCIKKRERKRKKQFCISTKTKSELKKLKRFATLDILNYEEILSNGEENENDK